MFALLLPLSKAFGDTKSAKLMGCRGWLVRLGSDGPPFRPPISAAARRWSWTCRHHRIERRDPLVEVLRSSAIPPTATSASSASMLEAAAASELSTRAATAAAAMVVILSARREDLHRLGLSQVELRRRVASPPSQSSSNCSAVATVPHERRVQVLQEHVHLGLGRRWAANGVEGIHGWGLRLSVRPRCGVPPTCRPRGAAATACPSGGSSSTPTERSAEKAPPPPPPTRPFRGPSAPEVRVPRSGGLPKTATRPGPEAAASRPCSTSYRKAKPS